MKAQPYSKNRAGEAGNSSSISNSRCRRPLACSPRSAVDRSVEDQRTSAWSADVGGRHHQIETAGDRLPPDLGSASRMAGHFCNDRIRIKARNDIAWRARPTSLSLLLRSLRAAEAITGCGPASQDAVASWRGASPRSAAWIGTESRHPAVLSGRRRGHGEGTDEYAWLASPVIALRALPGSTARQRRLTSGPPFRRGEPAADCKLLTPVGRIETAARAHAGAKPDVSNRSRFDIVDDYNCPARSIASPLPPHRVGKAQPCSDHRDGETPDDQPTVGVARPCGTIPDDVPASRTIGRGHFSLTRPARPTSDGNRHRESRCDVGSSMKTSGIGVIGVPPQKNAGGR